MTASTRRTLSVASALTAAALVGSIVAFVAGQPDVAVSIVVALSAASAVAAVIVVARRRKDEPGLHDFWLTFNAKYRTNLVASITLIGFALLVGAGGVALVFAGYAVGWALPLYAFGLVVVSAFNLWAGHRPFLATPGDLPGDPDVVVPRQGLEP